MNMPFRQHGHFHSYIEGRFLITEVTGPWNKELVESWAAHIYPLAKELATDGPHVGIAIIHKSILCPPDAFDALQRAVIYGVKHLSSIGQIIVADDSVDGRNILQSTFARLYAGHTPHWYCRTLDEAKGHAQELLRTYQQPSA
ncbi:MAG: hypothetical protein V4582_16185 [Pseudomonadota bacterium]